MRDLNSLSDCDILFILQHSSNLQGIRTNLVLTIAVLDGSRSTNALKQFFNPSKVSEYSLTNLKLRILKLDGCSWITREANFSYIFLRNILKKPLASLEHLSLSLTPKTKVLPWQCLENAPNLKELKLSGLGHSISG